jgi:IS605 OrfB family transposase
MVKKPANPFLTTRVLHLRLKDKHAPWLRELASEVNFVWNYLNETSHRAIERHARFLSGFDLDKLTAGATKEGLKLYSQTVQAISAEYVTRRRQFKRAKLRWRVSRGPRRSLGWIPFKALAIQYKNAQVHLAGKPLSLWDSYGLSQYELGSGSISEDARGRWYINLTVTSPSWPKAADLEQVSTQALGIDLGLKSLMAESQGGVVEAQQFYRHLEPKLAAAQRAGNKNQVRSIHARIANRRNDHLHKLSTRLVGKHQAIFVGDVNARALSQTKMAKSVLDAGWSTFRTMLQYKCDNAGVWFRQINESHSTQECSACHARTGPVGLEGLGVRAWTCSSCGAEHDRDTNSARVIEQRGLAWLVEEFSAASQEAQREPGGVVNKVSQHSRAQRAAAAGVGHGPLAVETP